MSFESQFQDKLNALRAQGLSRELNRSSGISLIHNDYLGFSKHPRIVESGRQALEKWGTGSRGSRLLGGNSDVFEELETNIASFFRSPCALFFSTGYLANLALMQTLSQYVDIVVSDEKNHASLIDGIRLAGVSKLVLPHQQWSSVFEKVATKRCLLVTEALFSMDGDFADLEAFFELGRSTDSFLVVDEAHSAGVFPRDGRGLSSLWDRDWSRLAVVVTFGKAFGVAGAAILCSRSLKDVLINTARPFIYSTAPSPVIAAMVNQSLAVVAAGTEQRLELWRRSRLSRDFLAKIQRPFYPYLPVYEELFQCSPIIPFFVPGEVRALRFSENMRRSGIELRAIRYPTVARGSERIRISLHLGVSWDQTLLVLSEVAKKWTEFSSLEPIPE